MAQIEQTALWDEAEEAPRFDVASGAVWLRRFLSHEEQQRLAREACAFLDGPAGGFVPVVRGGGRMHVRMTCLGRHWNAMTYRYESNRSDFDNLPVPPVPERWRVIARRAANEGGFDFAPDVCIVNAYDAEGRMGLHQDKDEGAESLTAGAPVVSLSLGDTARFLFGGLRRKEAPKAMWLRSGDAFVFGGPARLCYHGVSRIVSNTAPPGLALTGRINLTFRQY